MRPLRRATDPDGGEITYSISDTTYYEIDADTGEVTLTEAGAALVNTDSGAALPGFTVTATSAEGADAGSGSTANAIVTPSVTQVDDALTFSMGDPVTFTEDLASEGATVATVLSASDPDGGEITYSISDTTYYEIDADTGEVTLTEAGAALVNTDSGAALPGFTVTASLRRGRLIALPRMRLLLQV